MPDTRGSSFTPVQRTVLSDAADANGRVSAVDSSSFHPSFRQTIGSVGHLDRTERVRSTDPTRETDRPFTQRAVGVVVGDTSRGAMGAPVVKRVLRGIEEALWADGNVMTLLRSSEMRKALAEQLERPLAGVLRVNAPVGARGKPIPPGVACVEVFHTDDVAHAYDRVIEDELAIGVRAAEALLARGCRQIALVSPYPSTPRPQTRKKAFIETCTRAGITVNVLETSDSPADLSGIRPAIDMLVRSTLPARIGLYLAGADDSSLRICHVLDGIGVTPGEDVEVVFGHHAPEQDVWPRRPGVLVVDTAPERTGALAVEMFKWRLDHPSDPCRSLLVEPKIISSGAIPVPG